MSETLLCEVCGHDLCFRAFVCEFYEAVNGAANDLWCDYGDFSDRDTEFAEWLNHAYCPNCDACFDQNSGDKIPFDPGILLAKFAKYARECYRRGIQPTLPDLATTIDKVEEETKSDPNILP